MMSEYQILRPFISNYIFDEMYKYKDFNKKEVVGVMVSASSLIRKDYTINRVRNFISKNGLSIIVSEEGFEDSNRFVIHGIENAKKYVMSIMDKEICLNDLKGIHHYSVGWIMGIGKVRKCLLCDKIDESYKP